MLVLSRYINESIMIGNDISLMVVDVRGDKVRLGINAPPDIPVHRKEVYDAIQRENERAKETKKRTEKDKGSELENLTQDSNSELKADVKESKGGLRGKIFGTVARILRPKSYRDNFFTQNLEYPYSLNYLNERTGYLM